jgi:methyltransferase (TIGR00027 family)
MAAAARAAHLIVDHEPVIFADELAATLLGEQADELISYHRMHGTHLVLSCARAQVLCRSRFTEDHLAACVRRGLTQYVILGAGLDSFAYRTESAVRVFEVDHPATQQWKRDLLNKNSIATPRSLTYAPVDFEHQQLTAQLAAAGHDASKPTFFAWLGVVPYLTHAAFRSTLTLIASAPVGSGVVMDYGQPRSALPFLEKLAHDSLASRVQLAGEPFQLFFTPLEMAAELSAFRNIEDLGSTELNARYFAERKDNLKLLGSAGRIVSAWV